MNSVCEDRVDTNLRLINSFTTLLYIKMSKIEWIASNIVFQTWLSFCMTHLFNTTFIITAIQDENFSLPCVAEKKLFFDSFKFSLWGLQIKLTKGRSD